MVCVRVPGSRPREHARPTNRPTHGDANHRLPPHPELRTTVKACQLTGLRDMALRDVPDPDIHNPTDVLIRMGAVGVCGSDIHYYNTGRIGSLQVEYPFTVGHECAGPAA